MKIERKIERRITVSAAEVYAALAKAHDLANDKADEAFFDFGSTRAAQVELVHIGTYSQELAE